jgi:hypothetical protein
VLFDKAWQKGSERVEAETGVKVTSLISIQEITADGSIVLK